MAMLSRTTSPSLNSSFQAISRRHNASFHSINEQMDVY